MTLSCRKTHSLRTRIVGTLSIFGLLHFHDWWAHKFWDLACTGGYDKAALMRWANDNEGAVRFVWVWLTPVLFLICAQLVNTLGPYKSKALPKTVTHFLIYVAFATLGWYLAAGRFSAVLFVQSCGLGALYALPVGLSAVRFDFAYLTSHDISEAARLESLRAEYDKWWRALTAILGILSLILISQAVQIILADPSKIDQILPGIGQTQRACILSLGQETILVAAALSAVMASVGVVYELVKIINHVHDQFRSIPAR